MPNFIIPMIIIAILSNVSLLFVAAYVLRWVLQIDPIIERLNSIAETNDEILERLVKHNEKPSEKQLPPSRPSNIYE